MIVCLDPVSSPPSKPGRAVLLDLTLPKSYMRFNIAESTRSPWSSHDEGAHLAVQLLEQRFRGISFGKLLVGRQ